MAEIRKATINCKTVDAPLNSIPSYRDIPWINLSGKWIEKAGFQPGMHIEIIVKKNEIRIKRDLTLSPIVEETDEECLERLFGHL